MTSIVPTGFSTDIPTLAPTIEPFVMVGLKYYIANSPEIPTSDELVFFRPFSWTIIALGIGIILHSYLINKWTFPSVRILTDLCVLGVILTGLSQILSK